MPWCPKCKSEFREGFTECKDCNIPLVDKLEEPVEEKETDINEEWVFLVNVKDEIEGDSIEALMDSCGIPVLRAHNDYSTLANVYTGKSNFGADLLVPESRLEEAKGILSSTAELEEDDFEDAGEYAEEEAEEQDEELDLEELGQTVDESGEKVIYHEKRRTVAWILLVIIGIPVLIALLIEIWDKILGK